MGVEKKSAYDLMGEERLIDCPRVQTYEGGHYCVHRFQRKEILTRRGQ